MSDNTPERTKEDYEREIAALHREKAEFFDEVVEATTRHHEKVHALNRTIREYKSLLEGKTAAPHSVMASVLSPPEGWFVFGALANYHGSTECWGTGDSGLPLWERPIPEIDDMTEEGRIAETTRRLRALDRDVEKDRYNCECQVGGADAISIDTDYLQANLEEITKGWNLLLNFYNSHKEAEKSDD